MSGRHAAASSHELEGRVALVTGATSGIGRATAEALAGGGAHVFVVGRSAERGEQTVAGIRAAGGSAEFHACDLADRVAIERLMATVAQGGRLDILVNNAAHFGLEARASVVDVPDEVWDRTMAVNLQAAYRLSKLAIPLMIASGGGSIVNVSSVGGIDGFPQFAAYVTAKGGLQVMTKSIALDYGAQGIRANVVCPGAIDTPGNEPFIPEFGTREEYEKIVGKIAVLGRMGRADEVASVIRFLAGDGASYVTGAVIPVDGGRLLGG
jgi:NAD(P)-dependent dehydrogenase (short-subunit alcohol dehydrogenase family)